MCASGCGERIHPALYAAEPRHDTHPSCDLPGPSDVEASDVIKVQRLLEETTG